MDEPHIYPGRIQTPVGDHLDEEKQQLERKARETRDQAKAKAHDAYQQIKGEGKKLARESGNHLKRVVSEQKSNFAEKLNHFRDAAKAAGEKLSSKEDEAAARTVNQAAGQIDRVTTYITESEPEDILNDLADLARKRPEIVYGGMFLVGLGLARFMKASRNEGETDYNQGRIASNFDTSGGAVGSAPSGTAQSPFASTSTTGTKTYE